MAAFGADDARGRMSAAADSAMTHAVEAAAAAREAKPLGAEASRLAKEAIARTGICTSTERNVSSSPGMCSAKRPRPEGVDGDARDGDVDARARLRGRGEQGRVEARHDGREALEPRADAGYQPGAPALAGAARRRALGSGRSFTKDSY